MESKEELFEGVEDYDPLPLIEACLLTSDITPSLDQDITDCIETFFLETLMGFTERDQAAYERGKNSVPDMFNFWYEDEKCK